jgi:hypothetical protein
MGADNAMAGTFVARRGAAIAGGAASAGLVGVAIAAKQDKKGSDSPLTMGQIGYLAVNAENLTLYATKRGAFKPKATDEVIGEVPRSAVTQSRYKKGSIASILEFDFSDGSRWEFDIGRIFRKDGEKVATMLGSTME